MTPFHSLKANPTFVAAIIAGTVGLVLTTGHNLVVRGGPYRLEMVLVGSLLAGFLAQRNEGQSQSAGIAAAIFAVLPTFLWLFTPVVHYLENYGIDGIGLAAGIGVLFVIFMSLVTYAIGSLGGVIGGWVENRFTA